MQEPALSGPRWHLLSRLSNICTRRGVCMDEFDWTLGGLIDVDVDDPIPFEVV